MNNITSLLSRLLFALALATGAGAATAVPVSYHVSIDTSTLSGEGYFDLALTGFSTASAVTSNFTGNAIGTSIANGAASGNLATSAAFDTSDVNYLDQLVQLGGNFSFDVLFDYAGTSTGVEDSVAFVLSLYNNDFTAFLGVNGPLATITLTPGVGSSFVTGNPFATVTAIDAAAVPEPGQWLLMLTGLLLLGAMARRRTM